MQGEPGTYRLFHADPLCRAVLSCLRHYPRQLPGECLRAVLPALGERYEERDALERLLRASARLRLTHVVSTVFAEDPLVRDPDSVFSRARLVAQAVTAIQIDAWLRIDAAFRSMAILAVVPDGLGLLGLVDSPMYSPLMNDIDLLVPRDRLDQVRIILRELGFSQNWWNYHGELVRLKDEVVVELEGSPESFGRLWPFSCVIPVPELEHDRELVLNLLGSPALVPNDDDQLCVLMSVDIHFSMNVLGDGNCVRPKVPSVRLFENLQEVTIQGHSALIPSAENLGWLLPYEFYHRVMGGMRFREKTAKLLGDITLLAREGHINPNASSNAYRGFEYLRSALYFVYRFVRNYAGIQILDETLAAVRPTGSNTEDMGDFLPTLLGERPLFYLEEDAISSLR